MSKIKWVNLIPVPQDKYVWGDHTVYLVHSPRSGIHKIGWTTKIEMRLKALEQDSRQLEIARLPYKLIHTMETTRGRFLERQLHLLFAHRHIQGEWYRLTVHDVEWIINLGTKLEGGIPLYADIVPPLAEECPSWDD
jgi:hypothetical protein